MRIGKGPKKTPRTSTRYLELFHIINIIIIIVTICGFYLVWRSLNLAPTMNYHHVDTCDSVPHGVTTRSLCSQNNNNVRVGIKDKMNHY